MKLFPLLSLTVACAVAPIASALADTPSAPVAAAPAAAAQNTLSAAETAAGWKLLFNGKDASGWRSLSKKTFPAKGWEIKGGVLTVLAKGRGGDIITEEKYSSFELVLDFRFAPGANSGIKYFIQGKGKNAGVAPEFQVLDDLRHPDAKLGKNGNRTIGSLYDLIPADKNKPAGTPDVWHNARIVVRGARVEHWLDGIKVVEFDRRSEAFRALVKQSKYKKVENFGEWENGHILLQDHGDRVSYRNIKIREIKD
ncbi:MAG: DUF1080 domain-containing protein [Puniceicoccales bacterium]|nr:DUF1080 domain-containing protein [Puniceicoccales bacterium]